MIWIFIALLVLGLVGQYLLIRKFLLGLAGFELLLAKFVEVNQDFYEGQKTVAKKDKELLEGLVKQNGELGVLRRQATQISNGSRSLAESVKNFKEQQKEIKDVVDELKVSKQIASALATVSNNIKLLDKIAVDLKKSITDLKRRSK